MTTLARWKQKCALVTGASSGIGRAIAQRLADGGMNVVVCARRKERLDELVEQIEADGGSALAVPTDLREEEDIRALFERTREAFGGVDVLVNNAGFGKNESLFDGDTETWRAMLEVNVLALAVCTREALNDMDRRDVAGHIIHIGSMSGHRVPGASGMYSATKYAVRSLTEGLRRELRARDSDIRVTAVSPGFVETEFAEVYHDSKQKAEETYSRFKVLQPEDIARTVAHVLSVPEHVQYHDVLMRPTHQES